ncbi:hypothetical protein [Stratiformator vulcanicus]|nr:hypothetical protein [Stratiformator vulcanicus]
MSSADGRTFSHHQEWGPPRHDKNDLWEVVYGNGVFVGAGGWSSPRVVVTKDGIDWQEVPAKELDDIRGPTHNLLFNGSQFAYMTMRGCLAGSSNGRGWRLLGTAELKSAGDKRYAVRSLAYGNEIYVGVGDYGVIATTADDGKSWTLQTAPGHDETRQWLSVAYGNGRFVIVGQDGYTATSTDGVTWENESTDTRFKSIGSLMWVNDHFRAIGRQHKGPLLLRTSNDGIEWRERPFRWKQEPSEVWHHGDAFYGIFGNALGGNTTIFRSKDGESWEVLPNPKQYSVRSIGYRPAVR